MKRLHWRILASLSGLPLLLPKPALAATIYVPTLPNIAQIQDGIDAAQNGDTVIVADGLRIERINFNGKLITLKSANGPARCIIDGMNGGCVVTFSKGETDQARLDGFTIQYGRSTGGGGIHIESKSSPIIANCVITNCETEHYGGGVHIYNSSPTLTNCTISGNYGGHGGAVSIQYHSTPRIINCDLSQNTGNEGGAIASYGSEPTITGCTILQNSTVVADSGEGGGILISAGAPKISHCTISGNYAAMNGGGVSCFNSLLTFDQCVISGNRAYYTGGGIAINNGAPSFTRCLISGNRNYYGGGGLDIKYASPEIANCVIWGNSTATTPGGGGINCIEAFPAIVNCTIAGNSAADGHGGGIESSDSVPDVLNTIVWGNSPIQIGVHDSIFYPNRAPVVSYCDVEGSYVGTANLNADPLFVNLATGDFHLQAGSPCLDTGSNLGAPTTDFDGTARPQDGNADGLAITDLGAYEKPGPPALSSGIISDPADPDYVPDAAFRNAKNRTALASKIEAVLLMIDLGEYAEAVDKLQSDILHKTDGCAVSGAPDKNDWIVSCESQATVYRRVVRAIEALRAMLAQK